MDGQLLNALGLRSLDEETLIFLKFGLGQIDGNEGAEILDITPNSFRVRAWRIRHRRDTLVPYEKKTGPKTRYKVKGCEEAIKSYRNKLPTERNGRCGNIASHDGRFLGDEGFERMQRRKLKEKRKGDTT